MTVPADVPSPEVLALRDDLAHGRAALAGVERRCQRLEVDLERALSDAGGAEAARLAAVARCADTVHELDRVRGELAAVHASRLWLLGRGYRRLRRVVSRG